MMLLIMLVVIAILVSIATYKSRTKTVVQNKECREIEEGKDVRTELTQNEEWQEYYEKAVADCTIGDKPYTYIEALAYCEHKKSQLMRNRKRSYEEQL